MGNLGTSRNLDNTEWLVSPSLRHVRSSGPEFQGTCEDKRENLGTGRDVPVGFDRTTSYPVNTLSLFQWGLFRTDLGKYRSTRVRTRSGRF